MLWYRIIIDDVKKLIIESKDEIMLINFANKFADNFQSIYQKVLFLYKRSHIPRLSAPLENCVVTDLLCYILSYLVKTLVEHLKYIASTNFFGAVPAILRSWVINLTRHPKSLVSSTYMFCF